MLINTRPLLRGIISYLLPQKYRNRKGTGGSSSAEYCYSVWLRHLVHLYNSGLITNVTEIKKVAEIGPGDSLGIGIAALLSGAQEYYAFDIIEHANLAGNIQVADKLCNFFKSQLEIPSGKEYGNVNPPLDNYNFPSHIFSKNDLNIRQQAEQIHLALLKKASTCKIEYIVPWDKIDHLLVGNLDLIYSQAVMEHVTDINKAYSIMYKWLKKGGIISHQIDFKAHELSEIWNGHWYINDALWQILMHGRKYIINRLPLSSHINAISEAGFAIKNVVPVLNNNELRTDNIKIKKHKFNEEDFKISSALIQAVKQ